MKEESTFVTYSFQDSKTNLVYGWNFNLLRTSGKGGATADGSVELLTF